MNVLGIVIFEMAVLNFGWFISLVTLAPWGISMDDTPATSQFGKIPFGRYEYGIIHSLVIINCRA